MDDLSTKKLKEKVALVTGAGRGMGKAIAMTLACRGASIAVCDIDADNAASVAREIVESGGNAISCEVDVSLFAKAKEAVDRILKEYDMIHILVNNAGILFPTRFHNISPEEWQRTIDVNLTGAFNCAKAVYGIMKQNGYGRIVNISSSAGRSTSDLGGVHYTASKAGLLGLTRHLAKEGGPETTVNAVCPGIVNTRMAETFGTKKQIDAICQHLPLRRIGEPQDVANLVAFLVSDESSYITGESIEIDGGELMI